MLDLEKVEKEFNIKKSENDLSTFAIDIIQKLIEELRQTRIEVVEALLKK